MPYFEDHPWKEPVAYRFDALRDSLRSEETHKKFATVSLLVGYGCLIWAMLPHQSEVPVHNAAVEVCADKLEDEAKPTLSMKMPPGCEPFPESFSVDVNVDYMQGGMSVMGIMPSKQRFIDEQLWTEDHDAQTTAERYIPGGILMGIGGTVFGIYGMRRRVYEQTMWEDIEQQLQLPEA